MSTDSSLQARMRQACLAARIERERALFQRRRARRLRRTTQETYDRILARLVMDAIAASDPIDVEPDGPHLRLIRGGRAS